MSANMANSAVHPLGVDKWVLSWTQAFAMRICVVTPPGECLRIKADMVLFAGNTVWSISERLTDVREDALYMYIWKAVVDVPCNLQRVVECSQWHAFFSTTRCSVSGRGGLTICQSFITDSRSTTRCRSLTLQRVLNKKACHWLHSTTRCRLHGTYTTAVHTIYQCKKPLRFFT